MICGTLQFGTGGRLGAARAIGLVGLSLMLLAGPARAQVVASPELGGTVFVGDTVMQGGTVVLHHLTDGTQGDLDSLAIASDGGFAFPLPRVPDPTRSDVFFASVRHDGVLYFGPAITTGTQLDSIYEIHAYDTLLAPAEGMDVSVQSRSVFFEPDSADWRVTELIQLRNDAPRTIVARPDGRVWSYPLPTEAREVTAGEGELGVDAARFVDGELVVRAALPPGERIFVVRYRVDTPLLDLPNRGTAEALDVLIREPAPALDVEGLELLDRVELEAGSTYLRFTGADVSVPFVRIVPAEETGRPNVQWAAVVLALILAGAGLLALRRDGVPSVVEPAPVDRTSLLMEIARLDESFDRPELTSEERRTYRRRRAELLRRVEEVK